MVFGKWVTAVAGLGFAIAGLVNAQEAGNPAGGALPATRPAAAGGNDQLRMLGTQMVGQLRKTEGCLGAEAGSFSGGKFVILAWFENKQAALRWYHSAMHRGLQAAAGMPQDQAVDGKEMAMTDVPDGVPVMALAALTFGGAPAKADSKIPFSGISIELYAPLKGGLHIGAGFAPGKFFELHEATTQPAK